jgi:ABC-2 type transport system ATP-binding protein
MDATAATAAGTSAGTIAPGTAPAAIRTTYLTREFRGGETTTRAVDGLTLEVPAGTIFGFLGPNGSGKTTTIRLLLGLLQPTAGRAEVLGRDTRLHGDAIRAACGALLEHPGIYERLSAVDNLDFYARAWRLPDAVRAARIEELLRHFDLWERRAQPAGEWSRGMKQKLAVARAILHRPRLLFLDEPTAGFDPLAAAALGRDLVDLARREGTTVFLTTHNLDEAERLCGQIAVIRAGRLLASGAPDALRARFGGWRVEISASGVDARALDLLGGQPGVLAAGWENGHLRVDLHEGARVAPLVRLLVECGAEVEEVRKGSASLRDAFLGLMTQAAEAERE